MGWRLQTRWMGGDRHAVPRSSVDVPCACCYAATPHGFAGGHHVFMLRGEQCGALVCGVGATASAVGAQHTLLAALNVGSSLPAPASDPRPPHCMLPCPTAACCLPQLAGVVTNLLAGLMGARWGIKSTLLSGLTLQLAGIGMLFGWQVWRGREGAGGSSRWQELAAAYGGHKATMQAQQGSLSHIAGLTRPHLPTLTPLLLRPHLHRCRRTTGTSCRRSCTSPRPSCSAASPRTL